MASSEVEDRIIEILSQSKDGLLQKNILKRQLLNPVLDRMKVEYKIDIEEDFHTFTNGETKKIKFIRLLK